MPRPQHVFFSTTGGYHELIKLIWFCSTTAKGQSHGPIGAVQSPDIALDKEVGDSLEKPDAADFPIDARKKVRRKLPECVQEQC